MSGNNRQVSVLSKNVHYVTCRIIIYHMHVCTQLKSDLNFEMASLFRACMFCAATSKLRHNMADSSAKKGLGSPTSL